MPDTKNQGNLQKLIKKADRIFTDFSKRMESRSIYEKSLELARKEEKTLETMYIQGKLDLLDKNFEDAVKRFDDVIKMDIDYSKAWHYKGFALSELGKYEKAITCYDRAIELNPDNEWSWYNKGVAFRQLGRYEEAITCYDKAIEINPDFDSAWDNKGVSLYDLGRYEEAITCFDKSIEINPYNDSAWNNKGVALYELEKYEEAITCYDKAIEKNPDNDSARQNKNLTLIQSGKLTEAEKERKKIYSNKKEEIAKSKLPPEEEKAELLEIDAWNEVLEELKDKTKEILDAKKRYEDRLADSLKPRDNPLDKNLFSVLRRWNSYTPTLQTTTEENLGGGYFLYWKGKGIVIDPGFNFIDNFLNNEFLIYDIDAVIITHAHVDHCSDFESILTLLYEYNEKKENKKKIDVFMNMGAIKKFMGWIHLKDSEVIRRVHSLEEGILNDLEEFNLRLKVTKALHDEVLSKTYSVGLIFELYGEDGYTKDNPFRIGYTSDTGHNEDIENQYKDVDIIIPHLGSVDESDFTSDKKKKAGNHLYLKGTISTINKSNAKLAIVSEFGEELGGHRITIIGALNKVFQTNKKARCLTGDIGLEVLIPDMKIKCHYSKKYVDMDEIMEGLDPENTDKKSIIYYRRKDKNIYKHYQDKNLES